MPYYLANGEVYSGEYHTHTDGTVGTGASHTSDSRILSTVDPGESSQNHHIRKGNSPLSTLVFQALRRFGDFNATTVSGDVMMMMIEFANEVIDDIRQHRYYVGSPVLDYYLSVDDVRPVNDSIIRAGLLFRYAAQQGSEMMERYAPAYWKTLNQHMWNDLAGNTKVRMRIVDDGTNPSHSPNTISSVNGLTKATTGASSSNTGPITSRFASN